MVGIPFAHRSQPFPHEKVKLGENPPRDVGHRCQPSPTLVP